MKLIKTVGFVFQFALVGFALAIIYLNSIETDTDQPPVSLAAPTVSSYAEAVRSSSPSVVTIYTERGNGNGNHPLLNDPVFG